MNSPNDPISTWHSIVDTRDTTGINEILADEVVFYSPVVHAPQTGKAITAMYLSAACHVFLNDTFRYVREVIDGNDAVLEFVVDIDGITVNGVDMLKWNDAGKLVEFKVMLRPLKAVNLIHEKMGAMLTALSGK